MRLAALLLAAGCSFKPGTVISDAQSTADSSADATPFSNVTLVSLGTSSSEDDPTLTPDMLEIYFERNGNLYYSVRNTVAESWPPAVEVPNVNTGSTETTPEITPDGLELYYASGQLATYDIYVSTRNNRQSPWSVGMLLPNLSTPSDDYSPTPATETVMYLTNTEPRIGGQDIWRATRANKATDWSAPQLVDTASTAALDTEPWVDATETAMYVIADHGTGRDIFIATRAAGATDWGPRAPVGELNSNAEEGDPWLSPDGRTMYFSSNRSGPWRIYMATR